MVSERDAKLCFQLYKKKALILPNGIKVNRKFSKIKKDSIKTNKLLFIGMYGYPPNREAIDFLIKEVLPKLPSSFRLILTGGGLPYKNERVDNLGNVPFKELNRIIRSCDICLAPIFSGSGTRIKVLEYFSFKKPVIATSKGIEGINAKNDEEVLIEENAEGFAKRIIELSLDKKKMKKISDRGYNLVLHKYSWNALIKKFLKDINYY